MPRWMRVAIAGACPLLALEGCVGQRSAQAPVAAEVPKTATPPSPFGHGTGTTDAMKAMAWLEGRWDVTMTYFSEGKPVFTAKTSSIIEPLLGGGFLQERITVPAGPGLNNAMVGVRSYDRYRRVFRLVWLDEVTTLSDIYEGAAHDGGFVVSNIRSGTSGIFAGRETFLRIAQKAGATHDEFVLVWEGSTDKGASWAKTAEYAYKRKE